MRNLQSVLLFCGGPPHLPSNIHSYAERADLVICADSGAGSCASIALLPDILVGDCDSIEQELLSQYEQDGVDIRRYPCRKDATDMELALDLAMDLGAKTVWITGTLGGRWDMSFANILLTASARYRDLNLVHLGSDCEMRILHPGLEDIRDRRGRRVSLLPLTENVIGVTLTGFEYPLADAILSFGTTRGVSNIIAEDQARVFHTQGTLLYIES